MAVAAAAALAPLSEVGRRPSGSAAAAAAGVADDEMPSERLLTCKLLVAHLRLDSVEGILN